MSEQPSKKSLSPAKNLNFRPSEEKELRVIWPPDKEKVIKVESHEEYKEIPIERRCNKNTDRSPSEHLTFRSFEEKELLVVWPSDKDRPIKVWSSDEFKDISIERGSPEKVDRRICKSVETPASLLDSYNKSNTFESCIPRFIHDELKAPNNLEDNYLRSNKPFHIAPYTHQNRVIRVDELENSSNLLYPNYTLERVFPLHSLSPIKRQVWTGELNSPPMNQYSTNSSFYAPDIPYEILPDIPSSPSYDSLDFLQSDSDYSSTKIPNRGFSIEKPDLIQTLRFKRESFDAKMKRRESELWKIPESRELLEVLKQTVMWPIKMLLITYAAPSNWVSCFFCGAFVETHCCLRSYKIVHGISFKC